MDSTAPAYNTRSKKYILSEIEAARILLSLKNSVIEKAQNNESP